MASDSEQVADQVTEQADWDVCRVISAKREEDASGVIPVPDVSRQYKQGWFGRRTIICWRGWHFVVRYSAADMMRRCDETCHEAPIEDFRSYYRLIRQMIDEARQAAERNSSPPPRLVPPVPVYWAWRKRLVASLGAFLAIMLVYYVLHHPAP